MVTDRDAANVARNDPDRPFDPRCLRFARDMTDYDFILYGGGIPAADYATEHRAEDREEYVIHNEGTYNPENGHFLCDTCYIKAGSPAGPFPYQWKCP